jgi:Ca-activated chloride channel family protein
MMEFLYPVALILLFILIPIALFVLWRERRRNERFGLLGDIALLVPVSSARLTQRWIKLALWLLTAAALIFALARPVWGEELIQLETQGVSIMIVLDVSKSMNAQDVIPSRLERAKLDLQDLIDGLAGNEIGLILFAGEAFVRFPLTTDMTSAVTFLRSATSDALSRQGTNMGAALQRALESFNDEVSTERIIVLASDGENHEGDPLAIAEIAARQNVTIHTLGYGTSSGDLIPLYDANGVLTGYQTDQVGDSVVSHLDETTLELIAERTGGMYQAASADNTTITNLITTITRIQGTSFGNRIDTRPVERFTWFVGLAILALSVEMLLPEVRKAVSG